MKPEIIQATTSDLNTICDLGRHTFLEAFAKDNREEDIYNYVDLSFSSDQLSKEMNNSESEFYLAILEEVPIGYMKINYGLAQTEKHDLQAVELERIYVLEAYYGKKVGKLLLSKVFEIAQLKKASCLWLGVWEKNLRAIEFYKKFGFVAFDKHSFLVGSDLQTDLLMQLDIIPVSPIIWV